MSSIFAYLFPILVIVALAESCMPPNMNGDPQQMTMAQQQPCPIHDNQQVYPINSQTMRQVTDTQQRPCPMYGNQHVYPIVSQPMMQVTNPRQQLWPGNQLVYPINSQSLAQVFQSQMPSSSQFNEQLNTLYKLAYVRWNFYKQLMDLYQNIYSNNLQNNGLNTVIPTQLPLPYYQQSYGKQPYYQEPNYQQPYNQQPNYQQLYNQQPNYQQLYNQLLNNQQPYSPQTYGQQLQTEAQPDLKNEFIKHQIDEKQPIEDDEPNYQSDYEDDIQRGEYNVDKGVGEDKLKKKQSEIEQDSSAEREVEKVKAKVSELLIQDEEDDDDDDNDDYDDDSNDDGDNNNNNDNNDEKKDHEDYDKVREEEKLLQQRIQKDKLKQNQNNVFKTKEQNSVSVKEKLKKSNQQEIPTNISRKTKSFDTQLVKQ